MHYTLPKVEAIHSLLCFQRGCTVISSSGDAAIRCHVIETSRTDAVSGTESTRMSLSEPKNVYRTPHIQKYNMCPQMHFCTDELGMVGCRIYNCIMTAVGDSIA